MRHRHPLARPALPAAVLVALALAGCGHSLPVKRTGASEAARSRLLAICTEAAHAVLGIDHDKLRPELRILGRLIEEAARQGERVDAEAAAKIRRLPSSRSTKLVLSYLATSRSRLKAIDRAVRHHGPAYTAIPRELILTFVRANSGCGRVGLAPPGPGPRRPRTTTA